MEFRVIEYGTEEYQKMVELRNDVLLAPIGLPYFKEVLENDATSIHCLCTENGEAIGCCVLTDLSNGIVQLRQMAVAVGRQSEGIGAKVIAFAEEVARENHFNEIMLHARRAAENFYLQNDYNFVGEEFSEVDIPHMKMRKRL